MYLNEYINRMEPKKGGIREFGDLAGIMLFSVREQSSS